MRTHLGFKSTARLSFTFCILWFSANYFAMACLQYTTVASTTILTSTSSIWTLLIGAFTHMEKFTWRKFLGVLASLIGIIIISSKDLTATGSGPHGKSPGHHDVRQSSTFPTKRPAELALGDGLALTSAIIYGAYTITLKRATIKAAPLQLNMPLFFGLVGFFNAIFLFPLFPILSWTGLEPFQLPPSRRIWTILMCNAVSSLLSDICWAYAMVFTSPLIVTVGLSLTIPVSLVGEMIIQGKFEGLVYWLGAIIVVSSFVFVDQEEMKDEPAQFMPVFDEEEEEGLIAAQADEDLRAEHDSNDILR
jgi:solute carrier family 35 protein F5